MKYKDKLVIIELPYPGFITILCVMKTISSENDRSFVVNPEFRDNPEKWHACYMCAHTLVLVCVEVKSLKEAKRGN